MKNMEIPISSVLQSKNSLKSLFVKKFLLIMKHGDLYLLLLPAIVVTFIFHYIPIYGAQIAFKDYRTSLGIWGSEWVGLKHFIRFIRYPNFGMILRNTLILSLYSLATFPLGVLVALLFNEIGNRIFKRTVQMVSYAPHFISIIVLCGMVTLFLSRKSGIVNHFIALFGKERIDFMTIPKYFPHIYVWSGVWQNLGWSTIIFLAAISNVSIDMVESAYIDGANKLQIMLRITLPTIMPTVIIMFILRCGHILSVDYQKVLLLQNALTLDVSQVISTYVYEIGLRGGQFSYASAIGLFNNIVNLIFVLSVNRISRKLSDISVF